MCSRFNRSSKSVVAVSDFSLNTILIVEFGNITGNGSNTDISELRAKTNTNNDHSATTALLHGHTYIKSMDQSGMVCQSCSWSVEQEKIIFPCPCACLRIWSRKTGSAVPSRVSLVISILRLNMVLSYGIPPRVPRRRPFIYLKPPYAIGSVPSLSGHAIADRWRSLPRVRRHRASKPQDSSERVLPWEGHHNYLYHLITFFFKHSCVQ